MQPEDSESGRFSKNLTDKLSLIGALAAALTPIFINLFPDIGNNAQRIAYLLAVLVFISSASVFAYRRWRKARLAVAEPIEQLAPTAALRGLLPFEEGDQLRGRAHDVQHLYTLVTSSTFRFGVLWGESGCGKTSLFRAGLVPVLKQNGFLPLYLAKPTKDPRLAIRAALEAVIDTRDDDPLTDIKQRFIAAAPKGKKIVVILDQFEEFFLVNRARASRINAVRWLGEAVNDPTFPVVFLVGIRADFFAQLQNFAPFIEEPTSPRTTYQLNNFDAEQAKQILNAAAKADAIQFEPALTNALVNDLEVEEQIRPAELQIVATRLKHKNILNLNKYEALGRAKGILSSYIGEEIKRSPNEHAARLILRVMCSETGDTKSPADLSIDEIVRSVSSGPTANSGASTAIQPEQVRQILGQFVAARILIRTDDDKYNLIHDYLALYVHTATAGTETNTERANRLLKRYVAESKEDPKLRLPIGRVREIQKYASPDVKGSDQAQRLILQSKQSFYSGIIRLFAIPLLPTAALYAFLANSYYLSVASQTDGPDAAGRIVVLSGHPNWKFVPGFDQVLIQSDFSFTDLPEDPNIAGDVPRERVSGFWRKQTAGYHDWGEQLAERLSPLLQIRAFGWLGQPEQAGALLLTTIREGTEEQRQEALSNIGLLARITPNIVTAEVVRELQYRALNAEVDLRARHETALILAQLAEYRPEVVTNDMIRDLLSHVANGQEVVAERHEAASILTQLAESRPQAVSDEAIGELQSLIANGAEDPGVRIELVNVLALVAKHNPKAMTDGVLKTFVGGSVYAESEPDVRGGFLAIAAELVVVSSESVLDQAMPSMLSNLNVAQPEAFFVNNRITSVLQELAESRSDAVSDKIVQSLQRTMNNQQVSPELRLNAAALLVHVEHALQPSVRADVAGTLQSSVADDKVVSPVRRNAAMLLERLVKAHPDLATDAMVAGLQGLVLDQDLPTDMRNEVISVFAEVASHTSGTVSDEAAVVLQAILVDTTAGHNLRSDAGATLAEIVERRPDVIGDEVFQALPGILGEPSIDPDVWEKVVLIVRRVVDQTPARLTDDMIRQLQRIATDEQVAEDIRPSAVDILVDVSQSRPDVLTADMIQSIQRFVIDRNFIVWRRALSTLVLIARSQPDVLNDEVIQAIVSNPGFVSGSWENRFLATSSDLQKLIATDPAVADQVSQVLQNTITDQQQAPPIRIGAGSLLVEIAKRKPEVVTSDVTLALQNLFANTMELNTDYDDVVFTLVELAEYKPELLTPDLSRALQSLVVSAETSSFTRSSAIRFLQVLIDRQPDLATDELIAALRSFFFNPAISVGERDQGGPVFIQIAKHRPEVLTSEILRAMLNNSATIVQNTGGMPPPPRSSEVLRTSVEGSSVVADTLIRTFQGLVIDTQVEPKVRHEAASILVQVAKRRPEVVTPEVIRGLQNVAANVQVDANLRSKVISVLAQLVAAKPEMVTDEFIHSLQLLLLDPRLEPDVCKNIVTLLRVVIPFNSGAMPQEMTQALAAVRDGQDSTGRSLGVYLLFLATTANPNYTEHMRNEVTMLRQQPEPYVRIAGAKLAEMILIGDLAQEARMHPDQRAQIRVKLERLQNITKEAHDQHIAFAVSTTLQEIESLQANQLPTP